MRIIEVQGVRVDTNHMADEKGLVTSETDFCAFRLQDARHLWRCYSGPDNWVAVQDDFGNLVQVKYLGRSMEW